MTFLFEFIFWISIFFVFYVYIGYLIILWIISLGRTGKTHHLMKNKNLFLKVTLLISAYNEEKNIREKLLNSLNLNYPEDLLEIIVVSDGSTDRTNEIVKEYADNGVILCYFDNRIGKTACLNETIPSAKGELIIFSDANSIYDQEAIVNIVKHFQDDNIGFVTGYTKYVFKDADHNLTPVGIYTIIEMLTKKLESRIGSCVGADGAIFAIQRKLFQPLKPYDINDFMIPLDITIQGFRGVFEPDAFCFEKTALDQKGEFKRQARITNRTLRAIFNRMEILNPFKFPIFSFALISHKMLRFFVPYFLIIVFTTNITIIFNQQDDIYLLTFFGQILFYFLGFLGSGQTNIKLLSSISKSCRTFIIVNAAILLGWLRYFQGETDTTWQPDR